MQQSLLTLCCCLACGVGLEEGQPWCDNDGGWRNNQGISWICMSCRGGHATHHVAGEIDIAASKISLRFARVGCCVYTCVGCVRSIAVSELHFAAARFAWFIHHIFFSISSSKVTVNLLFLLPSSFFLPPSSFFFLPCLSLSSSLCLSPPILPKTALTFIHLWVVFKRHLANRNEPLLCLSG